MSESTTFLLQTAQSCVFWQYLLAAAASIRSALAASFRNLSSLFTSPGNMSCSIALHMFTSCRGARRLSSVTVGGGSMSLTSGVFQEELAADCGQGEARGMLDLCLLPLGPDSAMSSVNIGRFHETSSSELLDGLFLDCATDGDAPGGFINPEAAAGGFFHPMSPGMSPSKDGVFQSICHVHNQHGPRLEHTHTATETVLRTTQPSMS